MALDPVKNFAKVTVSTGYDSVATSIVLSAGNGAELPAPATDGEFNLVWYNDTDFKDPADDPNVEIVRVTARTTDTLTVTRGQEGIAATTKNTADKTYKMVLALTKKAYDDLGGYKVTTVTAATSNQTAKSGDEIVLCDATAQAITVNLPTAVGNIAIFIIKKIDSSAFTVTIDGSGTETIDGGLTAVLKVKDESITIISDNANWKII